MIDKSCIGEAATHNACDCFLKRMEKLEAVAKLAEEGMNGGCGKDFHQWNEQLVEALAALRGEEGK